MVVLGPEATSEYFNIDGTIQSTNTSMYMNIGSDTTSYKTLTFGETGSTTGWGLEGDTIITTQSSSYGRREFPTINPVRFGFRSGSRVYIHRSNIWRSSSLAAELNFLACKADGGFWQVYFQTGSDTPSGQTCSNYQSLHLPCLC
jgi:hypothetical protein